MHFQDDRLTFLLSRPVWVNDDDVAFCSLCNNQFGPLRRRHHCRHCGNIFCQECSSRSVPLPQLGYGTKPARVCNGCFEVAYLVTYAIDEDHGQSTQIHGARGLLELIEKDNDKDLHNMVAYGGIDALIWLCRSSTSVQLLQITTMILAILAEKEAIRPVIITKWALPPLLHLIRLNTRQHSKDKKSPPGSIHSNATAITSISSSAPPTLLNSDQIAEGREVMVLDIVISCTHVLYQLARAGILGQKEIINDGVFDTLLMLATYEPKLDLGETIDDKHAKAVTNEIKERTTIIQTLAVKSIAAMSSSESNHRIIIQLLQGTDRLTLLLKSPNKDVRKYTAKSIAYLPLRNIDKGKLSILDDEGVEALVSIIALPKHEDQHEKDSRQQAEDVAIVSYACCALANFATNKDSLSKLMSQPHLLQYACNIPVAFSSNDEVHCHVARLIANIALYEENNIKMLSNDDVGNFNVIPTLLAMGQQQRSDPVVLRHVVRAIDNLSANVSEMSPDNLRRSFSTFKDTPHFLTNVMELSHDDDTLKRAESVLKRIQIDLEKNTQSSADEEEESVEDTKDIEGAEGRDATASEQVTKPTKKKNKKKKKNTSGGS